MASERLTDFELQRIADGSPVAGEVVTQRTVDGGAWVTSATLRDMAAELIWFRASKPRAAAAIRLAEAVEQWEWETVNGEPGTVKTWTEKVSALIAYREARSLLAPSDPTEKPDGE